MRKTKTLLLIGTIGLLVTSCQKEQSFELSRGGSPGTGGGNNNNGPINLTGDWNFVGAQAKTLVVITMSEAGQNIKSVTTSDYEGKDYTGFVTITDKEIFNKGIGYSVDGVALSKTFINGQLLDESNDPFSFDAPPTDNTSEYTRHSNDSITFKNSVTWSPAVTGGAAQMAGPTGARLGMAGDTLLVMVNYSEKQSIVQQGIPVSFEAGVNGVYKYKRK